jgi:murein tripeptide amidase MpaA
VEFAKANGEIVSQEFIELTAEQWKAVSNWHESRMAEIWEFERKTMQAIAKEFPALLVSVLTPAGILKGSA